MPAPNWAAGLGAVLGGDSEVEYEKGRAMGANTENALAEARRRVMENDALVKGRSSAIAAGIPEAQANAAYDAVQAGGKFDDPIQVMLKNQEYGFRQTAGNPATSPGDANAALRGVSGGPNEPLYKLGGNYASKFGDTDTVTPLPGGESGGGTSAGMQALKAFGFIDPVTGGVVKGKEKEAFNLYRDTTRNVDAGGVPLQTSNNPFDHSGPHVVAPASVVAANTGEINAAKEQGGAMGKNAASLPTAINTIDTFTKDIDNLVASTGFDSIYGARAGTPVGQAVTKFVSQDAADAAVLRDKVNAESFRASINSMRGLGQLSNAEGSKVQAALTTLADPHLSPPAARAAAEQLKAHLAELKRVAQIEAGQGGQQPAAPTAPAGRVKMIGGKKYVETAPGQWAEDDGGA